MQLLSGLAISLISKTSSRFGDEAVAAMGIVQRIITLGSNTVFGFMKGMQPFAGYNFGAHNYKRVKECIKTGIKITSIFCFLWVIVIFVSTSPIISMFSTDSAVLEIAKTALRANTIMFITFGFQFTYSTLYLAIGKAKEGGGLNICRQGIFFIPTLILLVNVWGLNGVIYTQAIADLLTTLVTVYFAFKANKLLRS